MRQAIERKDSVTVQSSKERSGSRRAAASRSAPARVSTREYEQLARDLQLIPARDEEDLPRLIDLIDEAN